MFQFVLIFSFFPLPVDTPIYIRIIIHQTRHNSNQFLKESVTKLHWFFVVSFRISHDYSLFLTHLMQNKKKTTVQQQERRVGRRQPHPYVLRQNALSLRFRRSGTKFVRRLRLVLIKCRRLQRVLPKNIWVRLPPAGSASLLPVCWRIHNAKNRKDSSFRFLTATRGIEPLFSP